MERPPSVGVLIHGIFRGGLAEAGTKLICFQLIFVLVFLSNTPHKWRDRCRTLVPSDCLHTSVVVFRLWCYLPA